VTELVILLSKFIKGIQTKTGEKHAPSSLPTAASAIVQFWNMHHTGQVNHWEMLI
jgi:hypothetical protein